MQQTFFVQDLWGMPYYCVGVTQELPLDSPQVSYLSAITRQFTCQSSLQRPSILSGAGKNYISCKLLQWIYVFFCSFTAVLFVFTSVTIGNLTWFIKDSFPWILLSFVFVIALWLHLQLNLHISQTLATIFPHFLHLNNVHTVDLFSNANRNTKLCPSFA